MMKGESIMKNEKMLYHTPELRVIRLADRDFLTGSAGFEGDWDELREQST